MQVQLGRGAGLHSGSTHCSSRQHTYPSICRARCVRSLVSNYQQLKRISALGASSDDEQQPAARNLSNSSTLQARQAQLEALLAFEGIEVSRLRSDDTISSSEPVALPYSTPKIDWSRYHLQLLFVDRTDTLRARVAAGIFDRIAEWNGFGRAMYTWTCGLEAVAAPTADAALEANADPVSDSSSTSSSAAAPAAAATRAAAVLSAAASLKLPVRSMARAAEPFELDDLDRYDLVLCVDTATRETILSQVGPAYREYYEGKVCLLTSFSSYESDTTVLAKGGFALLPMQLSFLLRTGEGGSLDACRGAVDITSPELSGQQGHMQWHAMVQAMILSTAGLAKYLMDAMPDDHWEPLD